MCDAVFRLGRVYNTLRAECRYILLWCYVLSLVSTVWGCMCVWSVGARHAGLVLSAHVLWFRLCGWLFDAEGDDAWGIGLMGQIAGFFLL